MTKLSTRTLSLYRSYLRGIRSVTDEDTSKLINSRRSFNPQLKGELLRANGSENALDLVEEKISTTLNLLSASPRLVSNLSSLSYHHHPYYLPSTSNSSRLYSHSLKPVEWDPQDPPKAMKAYEKRKMDRKEKGEGKLGELADLGLRGLRGRAEKELGVTLGRWEVKE